MARDSAELIDSAKTSLYMYALMTHLKEALTPFGAQAGLSAYVMATFLGAHEFNHVDKPNSRPNIVWPVQAAQISMPGRESSLVDKIKWRALGKLFARDILRHCSTTTSCQTKLSFDSKSRAHKRIWVWFNDKFHIHDKEALCRW